MSAITPFRSFLASSSRIRLLPITYPLQIISPRHASTSSTPALRAKRTAVDTQAAMEREKLNQQIEATKEEMRRNPDFKAPPLGATWFRTDWSRMYRVIGWRGERFQYFYGRFQQSRKTRATLREMERQGFFPEKDDSIIKNVIGLFSVKYRFSDTIADCYRRYEAYYQAQVDKDFPVLEAVSSQTALSKAKRIAKSSVKMTWEIAHPSRTQQSLSWILPFVFSRDPRLMWAALYTFEGRTIWQICVRFDTDQVLTIQRQGDANPTVKKQRVIEHMVFELRTPGSSAVFKIRDAADPVSPPWTLSKQERLEQASQAAQVGAPGRTPSNSGLRQEKRPRSWTSAIRNVLAGSVLGSFFLG